MATVKTRVWRRASDSKLTPEQVQRIRTGNHSISQLAAEFHVAKATIWKARNGFSYKRQQPTATFVARVTDMNERYSLGSFLTREAAQHAIDTFKRSRPWPRGSIERANNRFRVRVSLGLYDTRAAAEHAARRAIEMLRAAG